MNILPDILKVIILGIVEGLTEFLPVSSTGHLIVFSALLDFGGRLASTFDIFIQIGAVVAVIIFFRTDLLSQARSLPSNASIQRFWLNVIIAFIPAGAVGFLLADKIDELLFKPVVVAVTFILGGIIFLWIERQKVADKATVKEISHVSIRQAFVIGLAQVAALVPGVSRSGASIVGGMLAGLDRSTATYFSFYLAIPTLGLATVYKLLKSLGEIQGQDWLNLLVGAVVSGIVAWISIRWLLDYVARNSFVAFGYYRILAGIIILVLVATHFFPG